MEKIKYLFKKKIYIPNRAYYIILFAIPILGILLKNLLLQAYIMGDNLYSPNFVKAASQTWRYWIFYAAVTMLVFFFGMLFKRDRYRIIYVAVCDLFFTVLLCCDIIYLRSFFTMPSAADALILKNFSGFDGGEVTSLICGWDMLLFADVIAYAVFVFLFRRRHADERVKLKGLRITAMVTAALSVAVLIFLPLQSKAFDINEEIYESIYNESDSEKVSSYFSSFGFHIKDIVELIQQAGHTELSDEEEQLVCDYYEWKNEDLPDNEYAGIFEGKNVLFLQIESLESFVIGQSVDGQELTPNINRLMENGFYFSNVFEQVQGGNSSDADLMYATSRLPVTKGSTFFRYEDVELVSLPRYLSGQGYSTLYTQAVRGSFWNYQKCWSQMIGVDNFIGAESISMDYEKIGFTINDGDFINEAFPYISELKAPYYAHVVLNSSHMPFQPSESYKGLKLSDELDETYLGGYFQLVNYVDSCIGNLISRLEECGMLDNTIIVIIGDHTGIHKYYEYSLEEWYDEYPWVNVGDNYTVPFIISCSDVSGLYQSDILAGQIDVMPTLAYLLGMPKEEYENSAMGRNLLNTQRSYCIFRDGTVHGGLSDEELAIVKSSYQVSEYLFETAKN